MSTRFEWDDQKDRANQRKHGISFARATQVFDDPRVVFLADLVVDGEERWQAIGLMEGMHLVISGAYDQREWLG